MIKEFYNIIEIKNIDNITTSKETLYKFNDKYINVVKIKNDVNGNPRYSLKIFDIDFNNISESYKRPFVRYSKVNKCLNFQSYNLTNSIENTLNH